MKESENQPARHNGSMPLQSQKPEARIVMHPQTREEEEEMIFSMTTHAMREPDYVREKEGILAMTIEQARKDQDEINESTRAIHQRLGPITARVKKVKKGEDS